jgi:ABC-type proline/glycine betaine transport system permease subunit
MAQNHDLLSVSVKSEALQYAAKGPGLLGGIAVLLVAMVVDRIMQGAFLRSRGQ